MHLTYWLAVTFPPLASAGHRGGHAPLWIAGWVIVVAVLASIIYVAARRGRKP